MVFPLSRIREKNLKSVFSHLSRTRLVKCFLLFLKHLIMMKNLLLKSLHFDISKFVNQSGLQKWNEMGYKNVLFWVTKME